MDSCYLSVGSLRFLILPFPTEEFGLPCSQLTGGIDHPPDLIGFTLFRMCEKQSVRMPSLLRGLGIHSCDSWAHRTVVPFIIVLAVSMTRRHAASSKVHLHSSVRFSPCPVASFGSKLPWTLPLAFHLTVISDAERDWRQPWILGWEPLCSTQHKRTQIAPHEIVGVPDHDWFPVDVRPWFTLGKGSADDGFEAVQGDVGQ